jgi:hypothetical protein
MQDTDNFFRKAKPEGLEQAAIRKALPFIAKFEFLIFRKIT